MINTFNKSVYFFENYSAAIRLREECFSSRPVLEFIVNAFKCPFLKICLFVRPCACR